VAALIDAGAVGINLEDGASPVALLAAKVARVKQVVARSGVDLFVNARTDVHLRGLAPGPQRVAEVLSRAAVYREAGADGLFVPGAVDRESLRALAAGAGMPLNVMVRTEVPYRVVKEAFAAIVKCHAEIDFEVDMSTSLPEP
jgi:2-methylisocitrate lyase-like PEP mutase family enzyme